MSFLISVSIIVALLIQFQTKQVINDTPQSLISSGTRCPPVIEAIQQHTSRKSQLLRDRMERTSKDDLLLRPFKELPVSRENTLHPLLRALSMESMYSSCHSATDISKPLQTVTLIKSPQVHTHAPISSSDEHPSSEQITKSESSTSQFDHTAHAPRLHSIKRALHVHNLQTSNLGSQRTQDSGYLSVDPSESRSFSMNCWGSRQTSLIPQDKDSSPGLSNSSLPEMPEAVVRAHSNLSPHKFDDYQVKESVGSYSPNMELRRTVMTPATAATTTTDERQIIHAKRRHLEHWREDVQKRIRYVV